MLVGQVGYHLHGNKNNRFFLSYGTHIAHREGLYLLLLYTEKFVRDHGQKQRVPAAGMVSNHESNNQHQDVDSQRLSQQHSPGAGEACSSARGWRRGARWTGIA